MLEWNPSLDLAIAKGFAVADVDGKPVTLTLAGWNFLRNGFLFPGRRVGLVVKPKSWKGLIAEAEIECSRRKTIAAARLAKKAARGK